MCISFNIIAVKSGFVKGYDAVDSNLPIRYMPANILTDKYKLTLSRRVRRLGAPFVNRRANFTATEYINDSVCHGL